MYDEYFFKDEDGFSHVLEDKLVNASPELIQEINKEIWKRTRQEVSERFEEVEKAFSESREKAEEMKKLDPLIRLNCKLVDLINETKKHPEIQEEFQPQIDDLRLQIKEMEKALESEK